jgi:hypothetical protein
MRAASSTPFGGVPGGLDSMILWASFGDRPVTAGSFQTMEVVPDRTPAALSDSGLSR